VVVGWFSIMIVACKKEKDDLAKADTEACEKSQFAYHVAEK